MSLLGHRYYDTGTGRFVTRDSLGYAGGINLYAYCNNDPINDSDPLGFCGEGRDGWNTAADFFGGFGHIASFGLTDWINDQSGANSVVNSDSAVYKLGEGAAVVNGLFLGGASSLNAGSRAVFYSGRGALQAARAGKGAGLLLEDTLGGKALNALDSRLPNGLPLGVWKAASAIFALNTKGSVTAFLRNPSAQSIYSTIERPILYNLNKIIFLK